MISKTKPQPEFNLIGELKNLYVKIPLLQAIQNIPIYAKAIRDVCVNKPRRKPKDPPTVYIMGRLSEILQGKTCLVKYGDPNNPIVTVQFDLVSISNTLVDLGSAINIMTSETLKLLGLKNLRPTPTILELADRSTIQLEGILEDVVISITSWEYPTDFLVLQLKSKLGGHPLILGQPWLATVDAYISCRIGDMTISNGVITQKLVIYPPSQTTPVMKNPLWVGFDEYDTLSVLTIGKALQFKDETKDDSINSFISSSSLVSSPMFQSLHVVMTKPTQEDITHDFITETVKVLPNRKSIPIEIESGKTLNINPSLSAAETNKVVKLLQEN